MPLEAEEASSTPYFPCFFSACSFCMLQEVCNVFPHVEFPHFHLSISGIIPLELLAASCWADFITQKHWRAAGWIAAMGVVSAGSGSASFYRCVWLQEGCLHGGRAPGCSCCPLSPGC